MKDGSVVTFDLAWPLDPQQLSAIILRSSPEPIRVLDISKYAVTWINEQQARFHSIVPIETLRFLAKRKYPRRASGAGVDVAGGGHAPILDDGAHVGADDIIDPFDLEEELGNILEAGIGDSSDEERFEDADEADEAEAGSHHSLDAEDMGVSVDEAAHVEHYLTGPDVTVGSIERVFQDVALKCVAGTRRAEELGRQAHAHNQPLRTGMISLIVTLAPEPRPESLAAAAVVDEDDLANHLDAFFVMWVDVLARTARKVRIDQDKKVKYNVPYAVRVLPYPEGTYSVAISDVPTTMEQFRVNRLPLPDWVLELQCVLRFRCCQGPYGHNHLTRLLGPDLAGCVLCSVSVVELGPTACFGNDEILFVCKMCTRSWHRSCSALLFTSESPTEDWISFLCGYCSDIEVV
jgi:hypothetical protein